jgi:hypothetical protein
MSELVGRIKTCLMDCLQQSKKNLPGLRIVKRAPQQENTFTKLKLYLFELATVKYLKDTAKK